jgi:hypothetical protein
MLTRLMLRGVGPLPSVEMALAPRLNIITGDNGLGKSFLLDVAWFALTSTWARLAARPNRGEPDARIEYSLELATSYASEFDRRDESWKWPQGRVAPPGLVIYAQVDGSFSLWDPARNYTRQVGGGGPRPPSYSFTTAELWDGLKQNGVTLCNGLLADWASWQSKAPAGWHALSNSSWATRASGADHPFELLVAALREMSASNDEPLIPGALTRISIDDVRDIPTLKSKHGPDVPIVHASAAVRRMIGLCYLLVWGWIEHVRASELLEQAPTNNIVFLVDEIENHLHPRWQRRVLPALLAVANALTRSNTETQIVVTTHAPLVMASIETTFDEQRDRLWLLEGRDQTVVLTPEPWAKQGDVLNWLVSDTFGLRQGRSAEAEQAIEAAEALMRGDVGALRPGLASSDEIHTELQRLLPSHDPFWPRWLVTTRRIGGMARP